ncbi:MAG: F-box-like [Chlamydiales bacterium]|jgi:hypothetical protein|nr:F-box-like [Chlamydiales bacterium]
MNIHLEAASMQSLPAEMHLEIFKFLSPTSLAAASLVSHYFKEMAATPQIWQSLAKKYQFQLPGKENPKAELLAQMRTFNAQFKALFPDAIKGNMAQFYEAIPEYVLKNSAQIQGKLRGINRLDRGKIEFLLQLGAKLGPAHLELVIVNKNRAMMEWLLKKGVVPTAHCVGFARQNGLETSLLMEKYNGRHST